MRTTLAVAALSLLLSACASSPSARPSDASAAQHDLAAAEHEREARLHSAEYRPTDETVRCSWVEGVAFSSCWTPPNPTSGERDEAAAHRRAAAEHRRASQALRDAEALTCATVADEDRDVSPFAHRADILGVEALHSRGANVDRLEGALVELRPVSGLTPSILQRIVDCHLARNAALGNVVPEMSYCPLVPKGIRATVRWKDATSQGLVVEIRAPDDATAHEVWRRAHDLK